MPCIHARKNEIKEIAARWPEEIERIVEWERIVSVVSKHGLSSFFSFDKTPGSYANAKRADVFVIPNIRDVTEWAKTSRGGVQYQLELDDTPEGLCSSIYGLCESAS